MIYRKIFTFNNEEGGSSFSNYTIRTKGLTLEEYGVLIRLLSNVNNWKINIESVYGMFEGTPKNRIKVAFEGLVKKHYLKRVGIRDAKTGILTGSTYDLYEEPYK